MNKLNILELSNIMFRNKEQWVNVTNEDKEQFFFIFNRYFTKRFPEMAQLLNSKNIDKIQGMDLWFNFMKDKPYPKWFWSKSQNLKSKDSSFLSEYSKVQERFELKDDEMEILVKYHSEELQEELDYIKKIEKQ
jgi:hypothetical protein